MTLRIKNQHGVYLLTDPEVIETRKGPVFRARYQQEGERAYGHKGSFYLEHCTVIEEVPEQLELAA